MGFTVGLLRSSIGLLVILHRRWTFADGKSSTSSSCPSTRRSDFRVQRALHPRTVKIASVGYKPVGVLIFTVQRYKTLMNPARKKQQNYDLTYFCFCYIIVYQAIDM